MALDLSRLDVKDLTESWIDSKGLEVINTQEMSQSDKCAFFVKRILDNAKEVNRGCLFIGRDLEALFCTKLYKHHAKGSNTWEKFIRMLDLGYKSAMADHYRRAAKTFTDADLAGRDIGIGRLITLVPKVNEDGSNKQELLEKADKEIPNTGFVQNMRDLAGKMPSDKCDHPGENQQSWTWCTKCNSRIK